VDEYADFIKKVKIYSRQLYISSRKEGEERKLRKYSRKLKKLTERFEEGREAKGL